jgi:cytochrome b
MSQEQRNIQNETDSVKVWDRFLRFFHWTLALCFAISFFSGELHASTLHVLVGYVLCALLAARVYWGFKGSEYARFRSFIYPLSEALAYLRSMLKGNPRHYVGHNPAGALMVFTMFGLLGAIFVSGLLTLGTIDFEGPLRFLANHVSDDASYAFRHLHKLLPPLALGLVLLHLLGVVVGSIQHKENLARAMLTGRKRSPSPSGLNQNDVEGNQ